MHIQWLDIRKSIVFLVKPFTVAQPYFSALLIGFLGIFSINFVQSRITYYETIAHNMKEQLRAFEIADEEIRYFMALNDTYSAIYNKVNYSADGWTSHESTDNQLSNQAVRAEKLISLSIEAMKSLSHSADYLKKINHDLLMEDEKEMFLNISTGFAEDSEKTLTSMMFLDTVFIPYVKNYQSCQAQNKCNYTHLISNETKILDDYNEQSKRMNKRIEKTMYVLLNKQKTETYIKLILYWLSAVAILYFIIFIYTNFIKIEKNN